MTWQLWIVFGLFVVKAFTVSLAVGKTRTILTSQVAFGTGLVYVAFAWLVLWGAGD